MGSNPLLMNKPTTLLIMAMLLSFSTFAQTALVSSRMNEVFSRTNLIGANILQGPWEITYGPDDSLWITECSPQNGYKIRKVHPSNGGIRTILDLTTFSDPASSPTNKWIRKFKQGDPLPSPNASWTYPSFQGGLMGLAIHPDFMTNPAKRFVYIAYGHDYITPQSKQSGDPKVTTIYNGETVYGNLFMTWLVRFTYVDGSLVNPVALCDTIRGSNDHNSGRIIIRKEGSTDYLYYAVGDMGAGQFDNLKRINKAQWLNSYEGKILRFNLEEDGDATQSPVNYDRWIPNTNPYNSGSVQSAVWATGIRNNQGFAFAKIRGVERMYGSSHGPFSDDEINLLERDKNYGHPLIIGKSGDGNYDGAKAGPANSNLPLIVSESAMAASISNYKDPIFVNYAAPKGDPSTFWSIQHIYTNNSYASASFPAYNCGNTNCSPQSANNFWYSEGYSGLDLYNKSLIPGWKNSLMVTALKWGRMVRMRLDTAGTAIVQSDGADTVAYFETINRFRDMAVDTSGKVLFIALESSGSSSGPSANNPMIPSCAGCIQRYEFLGYNDNSGVSAIPTTTSLATGIKGYAETMNEVEINSLNNNIWVPITDTNSNIVAEIKANGNSLGKVVTSLYKNGYAGVRQDGGKRLYLDRNLTITTENLATTNIDVRLYITNAELLSLKNAVNSVGAASGVNSLTNLGIFRNKDSAQSLIKLTASNVGTITRAAFGSGGHVLTMNIAVTAATGKTSSFYFGNSTNTVLPTNLFAFTGQLNGNQVDLVWKSASEVNSKNYIIERSGDGSTFVPIGSREAKGGSGINADYQFTDRDVTNQPSTVLYYRLKMVDQDGGFTYSGTVLVSLSSVSGRMTVSPNPVTDQASVNATSVVDGKATWKLVDSRGRVVLENTVDLRKGNNIFPVAMKKLAAGIYTLQISGKGIQQQVKVQKL